MAVIDHDPAFWPNVPKGESLFIHKLAVVRRFAGQGIADAMIDHAKAMCMGRGIAVLRLDCHGARAKLRAVYERNGFMCVAERVVLDRWHQAFYECVL